jgi:tetratricopeptide (TPR) repeat protein
LARKFRSADTTPLAELDRRVQNDARALSLASRQIDTGKEFPVTYADLNMAISAASKPVKQRIFYQAVKAREEDSQRGDKVNEERLLDIFESLIKNDSERKHHEYHGQLGFVLRDLGKWVKAEDRLTEAIRIRDDNKVEKFLNYEIVRAFCRIGRKTGVTKVLQGLENVTKSSDWRDLSKSGDGKEVCEWVRSNLANEEVQNWLKANNISGDVFKCPQQ